MSVVSVVCLSGRGLCDEPQYLVQSSPTDCGVSLCAIKFSNPLHLTMVRSKEVRLRKKKVY